MTPSSGLRSNDPTVSIVIPARNDAKNLEVVLPQLPAVHEVILVDGDSVDGTVETALRVLPGITIVRQTRTGRGNAFACGFEAATGDVIVMFDAAGSADPAEIPAFVATLVAGADVAKGSRFRRAGGSTGNHGLSVVCTILLGTTYSDPAYGFNAFWRDVLPAVDLLPTTIEAPAGGGTIWGDGFEIETILSCRFAAAKLRVTEVSSSEKHRTRGESTLGDRLRVLKTIVTEKRRENSDVDLTVFETVVAPAVTAPIRIDAEQGAA